MSTINDWTVERLRLKCKKEGIKNWSRLNTKAELFSVCIERKSVEKVLSERKVVAKPLTITQCTMDASTANICIEELTRKYPDLVREYCSITNSAIAEGPALATIIDHGKLVGIIDKEGDVVPVVPSLPPPPPEIIPMVQVANAKAKNVLLKEIKNKTDEGIRAPTATLQEQILAAKVGKMELEERMKMFEALERKSPSKGTESAGKISMKQLASGLSNLKKVAPVERQRTFTNKIEEMFKEKKVLKKLCDEGFYWDERTKKCIPIESGVSLKEVRDAMDKVILANMYNEEKERRKKAMGYQ